MRLIYVYNLIIFKGQTRLMVTYKFVLFAALILSASLNISNLLIYYNIEIIHLFQTLIDNRKTII